MKIKLMMLAAGIALVVALLLIPVDRDPAPGRACQTPGVMYVHTSANGNVYLTCGRNGVWS